MSSIPGPLVRFVIDQPGLSAAIQPAMQQLKNDASRASKQIADSWRVTAAQIRADMSRGILSTQQLADAQRGLVTSLNSQIAALRQRNELNVKELASLKAMTLELERQKNALKTGSGVGITKGTENALNQVSTQTFLGITRTLDALVNRYFGGAAGAAFRTLRDTAYYSSMAGGATGETSILGKLFSPAGLATAGGVGALVAASAGVLKLSVDGGKLAVELTNLASKTGLTTDSIIKLRSATSVLDVDFDRVVTGFRKFSQEITLASAANLPDASSQAKKAGEIFRILGVNIQQAAKDPFSAVQQLSRVFSTLPDGAVKTALAVQLFGRGGMELLPVLDRLPGALNATAKSSMDVIRVLTGGLVKSEEDLKAQMVNFKNETDALEISLAQKIIPALAAFVAGINSAADAIHRAWNIPTVSSGASTTGGYFASLNRPNLSGIHTGFDKLSVDLKSLPTAADEAANKIKLLTAVLGTTGKVVESQLQKLLSAFAQQEYRGLPHPKISGATGRATSRSMYSQLGPAPDIGDVLFGLPPSPVLPNLGLVSSPTGILDQLNKVSDEYFQATASETEKIKKQYDDQLDYWRFIQIQYPAYAQQAANAINEIWATENKKLADLQDKQFEQYKQKADSLFKDLISGNTKSFTKQLENDLEEIALRPFQKMFETMIGGIFQNLDQAINGTSGGSTRSGATQSSGGIAGSILKIFGINVGPGGTAGTFPGSLGLGRPSSGVVGINSGQTGITTPTVNISAGQVNIGGGQPSGIGGGGPLGNNFLGGGFGSFFGHLNPFGVGNSFFGNLNPFGGSTSAGGSSAGGSGGIGSWWNGGLGPILGGLLVGGLGAQRGNVTSEAMGAASVAKGLFTALGGTSQMTQYGVQGTNALGILGAVMPGLGMVVSGISKGGVGGELSDIAGGASIGTAIMPGLGTAIGAIAGAITGGIAAIFGQNSWSTRVANALKNQAIYLPPSESFSFASNGSIAQTLQTGFGMSGNTGVSYALPSGTPFNASSIYGPLTNLQKSYLNQWEYGLNPNEPFFGAGLSGSTPPNPFNGNIPSWWGGRAFPTSPSVQVHLNLPGFVDQSSVEPLISQIAPVIAQHVSRQFNQFSSGMGTATRNSVNLP